LYTDHLRREIEHLLEFGFALAQSPSEQLFFRYIDAGPDEYLNLTYAA